MKQKYFFFLVFLGLLSFVFRDLLINFSTGLIDWRDYALMVWIVFQNADKITSLNFQNYFTTTSFYPNPYSLLFSDLLLPQSFLFMPFYLLTKNLILSFNFVFILTFILNYISSFLFWKSLFKKSSLAFLGSILVIFSPFFHFEYSHFQMLSYWPFFFALYFLFKEKESRKHLNSLLTGIFVSIQFLASVYLSFYLLTFIFLVFVIRLLKRQGLKDNLIRLSIIAITFLLICGVFIKGYIDMKQHYQVNRNIEEYIAYSANLSDYIFSRPLDSVLHNTALIDKWNAQNKSNWVGQAAFPGFLVFILSIIGIVILKKDKKSISLIFNLDQQKVLFLSVTIIGFIFSLGPRLIFNGTYAHILLPYSLVLKFVPLFESIRVSARWSFLFYFGLIFFALLGIQKITNNKYKKLVFGIIFVVFLLEYIPLNIKAEQDIYFDDRDLVLQSICHDKPTLLLELPVTHLDAENDIAAGLSYITKTQLASTKNECLLVNGYSGYDLPSIIELSQKTNHYIDSNDTEGFYNELKSSNVSLFKFNPDRYPTERQNNLQKFLDALIKQDNIEQVEGTIYRISK